MVKVVICSGGTGGHMFPACALLKALQQKGHNASIITDKRGNTFCDDVQEKIVLDTVRFSYRRIFNLVICFVSEFFGFLKGWFGNVPEVIVGFGGILTFVPIVAAKILGAKVIIYEQNSVVGKANKLLEKIANLKLSTFEIGPDWRQIAAPVRSEFIQEKAYQYNDKMKILVIGGSQGAASFSKIVPGALSLISSEERKNIEVVQQVSYGNIDELSAVYHRLGVKCNLMKFVRNVAEMMVESQLVICRSGASTLSELSAMGRPAILIPYPQASENHQFFNALYYQNKNAAWMLEEQDGIEKKLAEILHSILQNRELLKDAASHMINSSISKATDDFIELIEHI